MFKNFFLFPFSGSFKFNIIHKIKNHFFNKIDRIQEAKETDPGSFGSATLH
jgi:hypothetical protein